MDWVWTADVVFVVACVVRIALAVSAARRVGRRYSYGPAIVGDAVVGALFVFTATLFALLGEGLWAAISGVLAVGAFIVAARAVALANNEERREPPFWGSPHTETGEDAG